MTSHNYSGNVESVNGRFICVSVWFSQLGFKLLECKNFLLFMIIFLRVPWAMVYAVNIDWINDKASWLVITVYVNRFVPPYLSYHPANSFLWSLWPRLLLLGVFSMYKLKKTFIKNIHFISLSLWKNNIFHFRFIYTILLPVPYVISLWSFDTF